MKFFTNFTFSQTKFSTFILVINYNVPPILLVSVHFPPISRKLLFPYFYKCTPCFRKMYTCILHTLCVFRLSPYFDHDAFMHHTIHVGYWTPLTGPQHPV